MHPYLTMGTETVDELILRAPGRTVLQADDRGIPVGSEPVEGTEYDFRRPGPIGGAKLDHAFTDLERDDDDLASVELLNPEDERSLLLWLDDSYPYLQLFTGDPLPDVARRSLAVEPMTCAPNAFRTGDGLVVLEPGEATSSAWGIRA
jgi:aldose 1-epimerase